jgi:hypothetical protein
LRPFLARRPLEAEDVGEVSFLNQLPERCFLFPRPPDEGGVGGRAPRGGSGWRFTLLELPGWELKESSPGGAESPSCELLDRGRRLYVDPAGL